ncbi:hypothetical protein [Pseudomonas sp. EA_35y_Pfl2_R5]|uniref:hypothetical protein n=1 Tax=Pseudomonas sp. EA_35y_Pfl2_R5 TaxID=3088690 RepID=UPI0030D74551
MPISKHLGLLMLSASLLTGCSSQGKDEALASEGQTTRVIQEGVPGGVATQVEEIKAVVSSINYATSSVTLEDAQGHQRSFTASPEMINFPQLKVGDTVNATVVLEQVAYLREPGEPSADGGAGVIATAPAGTKPGMLIADSVEVTALVKGIDTVLQTATLEFADGTRKTVKVRPDVQLKTEHLNRQVVIRLSSALIIRAQAQ